jgi:hypothetical protein
MESVTSDVRLNAEASTHAARRQAVTVKFTFASASSGVPFTTALQTIIGGREPPR